jgi:hypothetical protein
MDIVKQFDDRSVMGLWEAKSALSKQVTRSLSSMWMDGRK